MSSVRNLRTEQWHSRCEPSRRQGRGVAMVSPLTDRWSGIPASAAPATTTAERLPAAVRGAVAEIAGAAGAWCPALSPEGDRVAYVTDRSGMPRLEVARLDGAMPPAVLSGPAEEVVSVAWSPDGAWLAY